MARTYSAYEAKAKFGEILRRVRAGQRIFIAYRGEKVAEIRAIEPRKPTLADWLRQLEEEGALAPSHGRPGFLKPLARKRGALARFLEARE
jgi:prevent-host-death family protein